MSDLQNQYIDATFDGLLHANGQPLGSGNKLIYDGSGQASALSLGLAGSGATINGTLSATDLKVGTLDYPSAGSTVGSVAYLASANTLGFTSSLPSTILADSGVVSGNYGLKDIYNLDINSKGVITNIDVISNYPYGVKTTVLNVFTQDPSNSINGDWDESNSFLLDSSWSGKKYLTSEYTTAKGAILYIEKVSDEPLSAGNGINIRSSRSGDNILSTDWKQDGAGHRCFRADSGTHVGGQFTTSIGTDSKGGFVYLRNTGDLQTARFKLSVQALLY